MSKIPALLRYALTGAVVLVAVGLVFWKYWVYVTNPWTRDGQVRANVIQVAPRVSAPIVALPINDNQFVKAGDLLFEIDPRTYQAALDQTKANGDQTRDRLGGSRRVVPEERRRLPAVRPARSRPQERRDRSGAPTADGRRMHPRTERCDNPPRG